MGNLAIQYGYQRFDVGVMIATIVVLVALVQLIQFLGDSVIPELQRRRLFHTEYSGNTLRDSLGSHTQR